MTAPKVELRPAALGVEGLTEADRRYAGSRFREVRDAVWANPYYEVWGGPGTAGLPVYRVTLGSVLRGVLSFGRRYPFLQAARRAVASPADLRWGPDGRGFRRLLHPNGVCLTGRWRITEPSSYSGYFRQGSEALVIARYSTCCTETRRGHSRSLALVGKLYPTTDPDHPEPLPTASFITQEDIGGGGTDFINDAELRNAPDTHAWRRGLGTPILLVTGLVFPHADRQPAFRQVYEIAELGRRSDEGLSSPRFLRFRTDETQPRIPGEELDFRDEVLAQIYDAGDPQPRRRLCFHIEVADRGTTHGPQIWQRRDIEGWRRIGSLDFDEGVASYNGDFVLHFHHPRWRQDLA